MQITNIHNLPETIARALLEQHKRYDAGSVDTSVTAMIQPPQITLLRKLHYKDIVKDLSEEFWALLGSGVHTLLEMGATDTMIVEERLFLDIDGWRISGAIDVQDVDGNNVDISDYKVTSVYSVTSNDGDAKPEWEAQLNMHALLVEANKPLRVRSLTIVAVLRDWKSSDAKRDPTYPQTPIVPLSVPLWSKKKQLEYARSRIAAHRKARFDHNMGNPLDECTKEERWVRNDTWAVMKEGGKRATKTFSSEEEAKGLLEEKGKGYVIQYRQGTSTRCGYCGVSQFCAQYASLSKEETDDGHSLPAETPSE